MLSGSKTSRGSRSVEEKKEKRVMLAMVARYVGACPCGALIDAGNTIHYDTVNHKAYCFHCGRVRASLRESVLTHNDRIVESKMAFECQPLIDDYRRLKLATEDFDLDAIAQVRGILNVFQMSYATNPEVRSVVTQFIDCRNSRTEFSKAKIVHDLIAISAKYKGNCIHCEQPIEAGRLCLYDRSSKRLHCLLCDC